MLNSLLMQEVEEPIINSYSNPTPDQKALYVRRSGGFNYDLFVKHIKNQMLVGDILHPKLCVTMSRKFGNTDSIEVAKKRFIAVSNTSVTGWKRVRSEAGGYGYKKLA